MRPRGVDVTRPWTNAWRLGAPLALGILLWSLPAGATDQWLVQEVYSNADGSIQFIELFTTSDAQELLWTNGVQLEASFGTTVRTFAFDSNLPNVETANTTVLIASAGYQALAVPPVADYGPLDAEGTFFDPTATTVVLRLFQGAQTIDQVAFDATAIVADCAESLNYPGPTLSTNSPENFAGETTSPLTCCTADTDCPDAAIACTQPLCNVAAATCSYEPDNDLCADNGVFCDGPEICDPLLGCEPSGADPCDVDPGLSCSEVTDTCVSPLQWSIQEVYSNADGSIQYIELYSIADSQEDLYINAVRLEAEVGATVRSFTFDANLPDSATADRHVLVGSAGYQALPVPPGADYRPLDGGGMFFDPTGSTVTIRIVQGTILIDQVTFDSNALIANCSESLNFPGFLLQQNNPENFDGDTSFPLSCCTADDECPSDGIACTSVACDVGARTCSYPPVDAVCDNGQFCDGTEYCDPVLDCQTTPDPCAPLSCDESVDLCFTETTYVVNATDDVDDGTCDATHCSLREALALSSVSPVPPLGTVVSYIHFDIPGPGPHILRPQSNYAQPTVRTLIDGSTEPDFHPSGGQFVAPVVVIDGGMVPQAGGDPVLLSWGLHFAPGAARSQVRHLSIVNVLGPGLEFDRADGFVLEGNLIGLLPDGTVLGNDGFGVRAIGVDDAVIGGNLARERNVISGNGSHGIHFAGQGADFGFDNRIEGNYIGTSLDGSAVALGVNPTYSNDIGISMFSRRSTLVDNVVSGNNLGLQVSQLDHTVIRNIIGADESGLVPLGNTLAGLQLLNAPNAMVGVGAGNGNVIVANGQGVTPGPGILVTDAGTANVVIQNNLIGVAADGATLLGNYGDGIEVENGPPGLEVLDNVIGGNLGGGVNMGPSTTDAVVDGNLIGTDGAGGDLGNGGFGVSFGNNTADCTVLDNDIRFNGIDALPPQPGVEIGDTNFCIVEDNDIVSNGGDGVRLYGNDGPISVSQNRIDRNGGLGIDLEDPTDGVNANDGTLFAGDTNNGIDWPVIDSVDVAGGNTTITGTFTCPAGDYRLELFSSPAADPSGNGEGATFLGSLSLAAGDFTGDVASFQKVLALAVPPGEAVTATVTDTDGNTSELGNAVPVGPLLSIGDVSLFEGDSGTTSFDFTVTLTPVSAQMVSVDWETVEGSATDGVDFAGGIDVVDFAPGETTQTISIPVFGDTDSELDEDFTVVLSNPMNAALDDGLGLGTILNDDTAALAVNDAAVVEGDYVEDDVRAQFVVSMSGPSSQQVQVDYRTIRLGGDGASAITDFVTTTGSLTFEPGGPTQQTVEVPIREDLIPESPPTETFHFEILNVTNAVITDNLGACTITDDEDTATVSIADGAGVLEGDPGDDVRAYFVVSLSAPIAKPVQISYATTTFMGSASNLFDFVATSGTLTFLPGGPLEQTVEVEIREDLLPETPPTEIVRVGLNGPVNTLIDDGAGDCVITDDDEPDLIVDDVQIAEGNSGTRLLTFQVTAFKEIGATVTFDYATADGTATVADGDYDATSGTLTFAPNDPTFKLIQVVVHGDTVAEADEVFYLDLSNISGAGSSDPRGEGTILDDDPRTLSIDDVAQAETDGGTTFEFMVSLNAPSPAGGITVDYTTIDGEATASSGDYAAATDTLTFAEGEQTQPLAVTVNGDTTYETDESFTVELSNPTNATIIDAEGLGTIQNDDAAPSIGVCTFQPAIEDAYALPVEPISVSTGVSQGLLAAVGALKDFDAAGANAAVAYTFSGLPEHIVAITSRQRMRGVVGDAGVFNDVLAVTGAVADLDESGSVDAAEYVAQILAQRALGPTGLDEGLLHDLGGGLLDPPPPTDCSAGASSADCCQNDPSHAWCYGADVEFTVALQALPLNPVDHPAGGALNIAPTVAADREVAIVLGEDSDVDFIELTVTAAAEVDGYPSSVDAGSEHLGRTLAFSVTVDNTGCAPLDVTDAATAGPDFTATSAPAGPIAPGASGTIELALTPTAVGALNDTLTLTTSDPNEGTIQVALTGTGLGPALTIADVAQLEGTAAVPSQLAFTVTSSAAVDTDFTVAFTTADGTAVSTGDPATGGSDYTPAGGTLTINAFETSGTIIVDVNADDTEENDDAFTVVLSSPTGPAGTAIDDDTGVGTIQNDDVAVIAIGDASESEASAVISFPIALSNPTIRAVTGSYSSSPGTASSNVDFVEVTGAPFSLAPGETSTAAVIALIPDDVVESDETFTVFLFNVANAQLGDTVATGTIENDDEPNTQPIVTISSPADGSTFTQGTEITFVGSASDAEDGDLTNDLSWVSDLDGPIGTGGNFASSPLSVGIHSVAASVTDSGGATGFDAIIVTVSANEPPTARGDYYVMSGAADGPVELFVPPAVGLLANDADPDGDDLVVELVDGPDDGTLGFQPESGSFTYTAPAGFSGTVELTYAASDGAAQSEVVTVCIVVVQPRPVDADDIDLEAFDAAVSGLDQEYATEGYAVGDATRSDADARRPDLGITEGVWRLTFETDLPPSPGDEQPHLAGEAFGDVYDGSAAITGSADGEIEAIFGAYVITEAVEAIRLSGRIEAWFAHAGADELAELGFDVSIWADTGTGRELVVDASRFSAGPYTPPAGGGVLDGNADAFTFDTGVIGAPTPAGWPAGTVFEVFYDAEAVGPNAGWLVGLDDVRFETPLENLAPVANDDVFGVAQGGERDANVLDNDVDPESDTLTAVLATPPGFAADFELFADGRFVYVNACSDEDDWFSYQASDGAALSGEALVTLVVTPLSALLVALYDDVLALDVPFFERLLLAAHVRQALMRYVLGRPSGQALAIVALERFQQRVRRLRRRGLSAGDAVRLIEAAQVIIDGLDRCRDR